MINGNIERGSGNRSHGASLVINQGTFVVGVSARDSRSAHVQFAAAVNQQLRIGAERGVRYIDRTGDIEVIDISL